MLPGILLSGPSFDYQRVIPLQSGLRTAAVRNADGSYTYTFPVAIPATYPAPENDTASPTASEGELQGQPLLAGTYTVGIEAFKTYTVIDEQHRDPGADTFDVLLGTTTQLERREVVTNETCNQCPVALALEPRRASTRVARARSRVALGDTKGALEDLDEAIELEPGLAEAWFRRGAAHALKGDHEAAVADFSRSLELRPQHVDAYYRRGTSHELEGAYEAALADYTHAVTLDPTLAKAFRNRAQVREKLGDAEGALADYRAALAVLPPGDPLIGRIRRHLEARG